MADSDAIRERLLLAAFFPFRLNRLADAVSAYLSVIYRDRFGLEVSEWRVLVTVGESGVCTAQHVVASTRMHKTRISRAIATLEDRKLVDRIPNEADRRELSVRLTASGRRLYAALLPLALERERALLACLSDGDRSAFLSGITKFEAFLDL